MTQGLDLGLLHCRQILYHLSHYGSPFIDHSHQEYQDLTYLIEEHFQSLSVDWK